MVGIYDQGDIIEVDFDPPRGHEPAKVRPALVVSSYDFNISNSMTVVCPISSRERPFFLHEPLPEDAPAEGSIIMEQLHAIDLEARPTRLLGQLDRATLHHVLVCLRSFFDEDPAENELPGPYRS